MDYRIIFMQLLGRDKLKMAVPDKRMPSVSARLGGVLGAPSVLRLGVRWRLLLLAGLARRAQRRMKELFPKLEDGYGS